MMGGEPFWKMLLTWRWIFLLVAIILFIKRTMFGAAQPPSFLLAVESNCWIFSVFAFAYKYLNRGNWQLTYLKEAAYPVYILHMAFLFLGAWLLFPLKLAVMFFNETMPVASMNNPVPLVFPMKVLAFVRVMLYGRSVRQTPVPSSVQFSRSAPKPPLWFAVTWLTVIVPKANASNPSPELWLKELTPVSVMVLPARVLQAALGADLRQLSRVAPLPKL